jgi:hypothetical protein
MTSWTQPSILLRTAAVLTLLYGVGHTIGAPWTPATGPREAAVIEAMKSVRFDAMGSSRSYWDFYVGFGAVISGYLAVQALVLWQLGTLARTEAARISPIIATFFAGFVVNAVLVWSFFFAPPLILAVAIAACLGLAFVRARPSRPA